MAFGDGRREEATTHADLPEGDARGHAIAMRRIPLHRPDDEFYSSTVPSGPSRVVEGTPSHIWCGHPQPEGEPSSSRMKCWRGRGRLPTTETAPSLRPTPDTSYVPLAATSSRSADLSQKSIYVFQEASALPRLLEERSKTHPV